MNWIEAMMDRLGGLIETGGPVIAIIAVISVATLAVILYKGWPSRCRPRWCCHGSTRASPPSARWPITR